MIHGFFLRFLKGSSYDWKTKINWGAWAKKTNVEEFPQKTLKNNSLSSRWSKKPTFRPRFKLQMDKMDSCEQVLGDAFNLVETFGFGPISLDHLAVDILDIPTSHLAIWLGSWKRNLFLNMTSLKTWHETWNILFLKREVVFHHLPNRDVFWVQTVSFLGSILNPKLNQIHLEVDVRYSQKKKQFRHIYSSLPSLKLT